MLLPKRLSQSLLTSCMLLAGCATQALPGVGSVVVAPKARLEPLPAVVLATQPKPAGYFQKALLDYSLSLPATLTKSTLPMQAAEPTQ